MGRKDWHYVHLPKLLTKRLDQFLETPRARTMGMFNKPELLRHIINNFLEEQEGFYKNLESINDFILQIRDRDHLAFIYNEKSQFEEIVDTFIKRGINYNQINILVICKREESQFLQSLNKIEKIDSLFNSRDIMIILTDECFPDESYPVEPPGQREIRMWVKRHRYTARKTDRNMRTLSISKLDGMRQYKNLRCQLLQFACTNQFQITLKIVFRKSMIL